MLSRRGFVTGLVGIIAAPAIVRASSLMPVKAWVEPDYDGMGHLARIDQSFLGNTSWWGESVPYYDRLEQLPRAKICDLINKAIPKGQLSDALDYMTVRLAHHMDLKPTGPRCPENSELLAT